MSEKPIKRRRPPAGKRNPAKSAAEPSAPGRAVLTPEERQRLIAEAAYFRAERRGFTVGGELDDWLAAEAEIDREAEMGGSRSRHSVQHM